MKKLQEMVPGYTLFPLIGCWIVNVSIYYGTMVFNTERYKYNITTVIDEMMPLSTWWIAIYYLAFPFWVISYVLIMRQGKDICKRFMIGEILGKIVCGLIYLVFPTTNIRPPINGNSIFEALTRFLYATDLPENLLPSIHCYISWLCFIGLYNAYKINGNYSKIFVVSSGIFSILIFLSTLFLKQHIIYDVILGVILAQIFYNYAQKIKFEKREV